MVKQTETSKLKVFTPAQQRLLSMRIVSFLYVEMFIGDDTEPRKIGLVHEDHYVELTKEARRNFANVKFKTRQVQFIPGSFSQNNGHKMTDEQEAIAKLLKNVLAVTFDELPVGH